MTSGRTICAVEDCERFAKAHGLCQRHYWRWHKYGDPLAGGSYRERESADPVASFWARFTVTPGCWRWTGNLNGSGYGQYSAGGYNVLAHRMSYEIHVGPIPDGFTIDHLCRNHWCVNPAHFEVVTARENTLRGEGPTALNARKTHCKWGHEFTPENTYRRGNHRYCRACWARRRQQKRELRSA